MKGKNSKRGGDRESEKEEGQIERTTKYGDHLQSLCGEKREKLSL